MKHLIMENKIIVIYIGIKNIRSEDINAYINKVTNKIIPSTIEAEFIVIPINSLDTRIECINPKYITDENLIKEHSNLISELNIKLNEQLKIIKEDN